MRRKLTYKIFIKVNKICNEPEQFEKNPKIIIFSIIKFNSNHIPSTWFNMTFLPNIKGL